MKYVFRSLGSFFIAVPRNEEATKAIFSAYSYEMLLPYLGSELLWLSAVHKPSQSALMLRAKTKNLDSK
jgi:hypothetical protein